PQQMRKQRTPHTPATQQAAADQQTDEFASLVGAFLVGPLLALIILFLRLTALAHQMREQQVAQAAATQQTAADQQPYDTSFRVGVVLARGLLAFIFFVVALAAFAQQVRKQQVAQATTTQQPATDEQPYDAAPLIAAFAFFTLEVLVLRFVTVTDQASE